MDAKISICTWAVAALFLAGGSAAGAHEGHKYPDDPPVAIESEDANGCKDQDDCATVEDECEDPDDCAGKDSPKPPQEEGDAAEPAGEE
jgi:hypothetical protein